MWTKQSRSTLPAKPLSPSHFIHAPRLLSFSQPLYAGCMLTVLYQCDEKVHSFPHIPSNHCIWLSWTAQYDQAYSVVYIIVVHIITCIVVYIIGVILQCPDAPLLPVPRFVLLQTCDILQDRATQEHKLYPPPPHHLLYYYLPRSSRSAVDSLVSKKANSLSSVSSIGDSFWITKSALPDNPIFSRLCGALTAIYYILKQ